ncbi:hypothetical protein ACFPRL_09820 [Pseudoclavibacter helvolus]
MPANELLRTTTSWTGAFDEFWMRTPSDSSMGAPRNCSSSWSGQETVHAEMSVACCCLMRFALS